MNTSLLTFNKTILDRFLDETLDKLSDMCNGALASRHGWIIELYARLYGVTVGHSVSYNISPYSAIKLTL